MRPAPQPSSCISEDTDNLEPAVDVGTGSWVTLNLERRDLEIRYRIFSNHSTFSVQVSDLVTPRLMQPTQIGETPESFS
jgi:hypothetical protein